MEGIFVGEFDVEKGCEERRLVEGKLVVYMLVEGLRVAGVIEVDGKLVEGG